MLFRSLKGVYTQLEQTIDSFERLCNGEGDDLPEGAFMYQGGIDKVVEKAKKS